ncbi:hypothetical protein GOBAR_AA33751 [Gossypium barbadense]|uniref:Uncharacterized protein n=1 Tax=Gossypium barbadense TaxID=3634 RepID=A0A2P5W753_GOSBA|nr:hypothetical protein GOBAR_AA33751 [Gossypium barbadense]
MLSKFISVSETHFQNTKTTLEDQQASIQGLETQIGQLSKLISERPQGSLPSNIEPNPREHLNAISTQNKDGLIAPEPEIQQNNAMNKGQEKVNNNDPKQHTRPGTLACLKPWPNRGRDMTVRYGRVEAGHDFPKTRARRSRSLPRRDVGDQVLPRYVLQPKFGTRSLNFSKLCRRSYFRYYTHGPSQQVTASTGLP